MTVIPSKFLRGTENPPRTMVREGYQMEPKDLKAAGIPKEERPSMTTKQAAVFLSKFLACQVKAATLAKWRARRKGPMYHKGSGTVEVLYSESDLIAHVKASRVDPKDRKPNPRRKRGAR